MASKYKVDPQKFSTVLTSCGRFDLLGETVASFQRYFDVERILIAEDSEDSASAAAFARAFPVADVRVNLPKLGQMRSIDAHYANLSAPYVVHLEDDIRRAQVRVMRIDGAHLPELRQVDAYVGDREVGGKFCRAGPIF